MYTVIAILITAGILWLTVLGASCNTVREMKRYLLMNGMLFLVSLILGTAVPFAAKAQIFGSDYPEEWMSWAWDAFLLFVKTTVPACAVLLVLICTAVFVTTSARKRGNLFSAVVRQAAAVAVSVIILFIAPFYSAMAETDQVPVHVFILILGCCEALVMRLVFVCEMALKIRREQGKAQH